ncbi:annexin D8-like [Chenopodium quinoa]|uniref:annexin D8-like n=1 Tax=Chenopodium quinoa TaxID=63459 RepID=UPI000B796956|nr:annexin D8-like [Chenopodium quinoa]
MATIVAPEKTSPIDDAYVIKKSCRGLGTDESAIILLLGHRNASQIKLIKQAYREVYQEDLIKQLKCEISGDFEKAICQWVIDPVDRDAILIHEALKKAIPDYNLVAEIVSIKSPEELLTVKRAYHKIYKRALEEDVAAHTTGKIRKFLVGIVSTYKYHGDEIDEIVAYSDANTLRDEIQDEQSFHDEVTRIISTRSKQQLLATFNQFKDIHGTSISRALRGAPEQEFFQTVRVAVKCIKNPQKYFAKILRNAIVGLGTDEDVLTRVIVTRAEIDLKEIKELYLERNNISLDQAVAGDTSGDYRAFLLTLLGSDGY